MEQRYPDLPDQFLAKISGVLWNLQQEKIILPQGRQQSSENDKWMNTYITPGEKKRFEALRSGLTTSFPAYPTPPTDEKA